MLMLHTHDTEHETKFIDIFICNFPIYFFSPFYFNYNEYVGDDLWGVKFYLWRIYL